MVSDFFDAINRFEDLANVVDPTTYEADPHPVPKFSACDFNILRLFYLDSFWRATF